MQLAISSILYKRRLQSDQYEKDVAEESEESVKDSENKERWGT